MNKGKVVVQGRDTPAFCDILNLAGGEGRHHGKILNI